MRNFLRACFQPGILLALFAAGCVTDKHLEHEQSLYVSPALDYAEALFAAGRYSDAIVEVSSIARKDPLTPGLPELQARIMRTLSEERRQSIAPREALTAELAMDDVRAHSVLPDSYRLKRNVRGDTTSLRSAPSRMQAALTNNVTVRLDNVDLTAFAAQIADSEGINIVADGNLGEASLTIHAEDTPLIEILEYVGRNLGVTFSVGDNLIWATASEEQAGTLPLETRIYRLRKGLAGDEVARPQSGVGGSGGGGTGGRAAAAVSSLLPSAGGGSGGAGGEPSMIEIIGRFVPQAEGADILYNSKAHVLVVRNTRENLALTEDIIEAMDVTPPQVLIEARFISAAADDLTELGVEWFMDSPYVVTRSRGRTKTQIAPEAALGGFTQSDTEGMGLNFTYQGVLTDPQFRAIVHILETSGKTRTLSVPRVTTINNRPANIRVGTDFRYYEEYDLRDYDTVQGSDNNAIRVTRTELVPVGTPTLEELGIELSVTPSVGADLTSINLALIPQISSFVKWEYYEVADDTTNRKDDDPVDGGSGMLKLPVFQRSRIDTDVVVRSGETVVMGGLITSTHIDRREGVPFLSHLPFVGQLFRRDVSDESRENLIIFVTATLISEIGEELIPLSDFIEPENELHDGVGASPTAAIGLQAPPAEAAGAEESAILTGVPIEVATEAAADEAVQAVAEAAPAPEAEAAAEPAPAPAEN